VRLKVEFTTEPFDLEELPAHARMARDVVAAGRLESVDVGPFGTSAEGGAEEVAEAVAELLRRTVAAGATRISLQVSVIEGTAGAAAEGER
jgi:uncharacterized protein YqgV (UPF0045/DUF77 family)